MKIEIPQWIAQALYDHTGTMPWCPGSWSGELRHHLSNELGPLIQPSEGAQGTDRLAGAGAVHAAPTSSEYIHVDDHLLGMHSAVSVNLDATYEILSEVGARAGDLTPESQDKLVQMRIAIRGLLDTNESVLKQRQAQHRLRLWNEGFCRG